MGSSYDNEEITTKIPALDPKLDIVQTETVKEETDDKKTRTRIKHASRGKMIRRSS